MLEREREGEGEIDSMNQLFEFQCHVFGSLTNNKNQKIQN